MVPTRKEGNMAIQLLQRPLEIKIMQEETGVARPELQGPAVPKEEMKLPTDTKAAAKGTLKDEG